MYPDVTGAAASCGLVIVVPIKKDDMEQNPYTPPQADLVPPQETSAGYYVVSQKKFLIMLLGTTGIYSIFWFYRNWRLHKDRTQDDIWPVPRAIFAIFFVHKLCDLIFRRLSGQGRARGFDYQTPATVYVITTIVGYLCGRASGLGVGSPYTDLFFFIELPAVAWALLQIQKAINLTCDDPEGASNSKLTGANWAWLVLGAILWVGFLFSIWVVLSGGAAPQSA